MYVCNVQCVLYKEESGKCELLPENSVRYGQEEIEQLLLSRGAREIVDIPQRELLPGEEDPAWVRKSSRKERTKNPTSPTC